MSFASPTVGYVAAEQGLVWKTSDGGATWTSVMNAGQDYVWQGIHAVTANDVVVSGFYDAPYQSVHGLIRWSHDGGSTWSDDIVISPTGWSGRVRFTDANHGLVLDFNGGFAHFTTNGGATADDWTQITPPGTVSWWSNEFSMLPDLHVVISGASYCSSTDGGATWATCGPPVDPDTDTAVFFSDDDHGWVAGSNFLSPVEGWVHRTTDGGKTWSARLTFGTFPINELLFINNNVGWAAGGDTESRTGGIFGTVDGGQTWTQQLDSDGHQIDACDWQPVDNSYQVWCAGYDVSFIGNIYTAIGTTTPQFSPAGGSFSAAEPVTITSDRGATIYYTTDGSAPTTASTPYTAPILVTNTGTIRAIAVSATTAPSLTGSAAFTITASSPAKLTAPVTGSTLTGTSASFSWSGGLNVTDYVLTLGSTPGGIDIANVDAGEATSTVVTGLPVNGEYVYADLASEIGGKWYHHGATYVAPGVGAAATLTSPLPGSKMTSTSMLFTWNAGSGNSSYTLTVGTTPGARDIAVVNAGNALYATVGGLPSNGSTFYVYLWSQNGPVALHKGYTFTAYGTGAPATITTPSAGTKFSGPSASFTWNAGTGISQYVLYVGRSPGANDVAYVNAGNATSASVSGLPTDGSTLYVYLWSLNGTTWLHSGSSYTAAGTGTAAALTSPAPGSKLTGGSATFRWNAGTGISSYCLAIGSTPGASDIAYVDVKTLTTTVSTLPTDGSKIYVYLYSLNGSTWLKNAYTFTTGP